MLSFWEKEYLLDYDFIIVGAGVIGLSSAISLKEANPKARILILERGILPSGASTKNVGFLSVSTLTEVFSDMEELGRDAVLGIIAKRKAGIAKLRSRLGDEAIGYAPVGGYELLMEKDLWACDKIAAGNEILRSIFSADVFELRNDLIAKYGFNPKMVKGLIFNPFDASVITGKCLRALQLLAASKGVMVLTGANVTHIDSETNGVSVMVKSDLEHDAKSEPLVFRAAHSVVCANALIPKLLPEMSIVPARGQVLMTKELEHLPWRGTFNFDEGYYYFRDVGRRVIVGGARHTDRKNEETPHFGVNEGIHRRLETFLEDVIFPGQKLPIEHRWSGIMGFGAPRVPVVRLLSDRLAVGFGCNSMGLAMGSAIGEEVAGLFT